jgi:hypothetical protein
MSLLEPALPGLVRGGGKALTALEAVGSVAFSRLMAGGGRVENTRLISNISRVSSNTVNETFISEKAIAEGWRPPYPDNLDIRKITTGRDMKLYRLILKDLPVAS